jgi:hypothetical protein
VIILKYMDDTQKTDQVNPQPSVVSVPVGGVEGAPVSIEAPVKPPEISVEVTPSEVEPVISEEEREAGVVAHPSMPQIHPDAKEAGVEESMPPAPSHPNFTPPVFTSAEEAELVAKTTSQTLSLAWIAEIIAKNFKRFKPEVN